MIVPVGPNIMLTFGCHSGELVTDVYDEDPGYIEWILDEVLSPADEREVRNCLRNLAMSTEVGQRSVFCPAD